MTRGNQLCVTTSRRAEEANPPLFLPLLTLIVPRRRTKGWQSLVLPLLYLLFHRITFQTALTNHDITTTADSPHLTHFSHQSLTYHLQYYWDTMSFLNNILARSPLSASFSQSPTAFTSSSSSKALMGDSEKELPHVDQSEKCELRVEGMTCGSCVEVFLVSKSMSIGIKHPFQCFHRQSKACSGIRRGFILWRLLY